MPIPIKGKKREFVTVKHLCVQQNTFIYNYTVQTVEHHYLYNFKDTFEEIFFDSLIMEIHS